MNNHRLMSLIAFVLMSLTLVPDANVYVVCMIGLVVGGISGALMKIDVSSKLLPPLGDKVIALLVILSGALLLVLSGVYAFRQYVAIDSVKRLANVAIMFASADGGALLITQVRIFVTVRNKET